MRRRRGNFENLGAFLVASGIFFFVIPGGWQKNLLGGILVAAGAGIATL